jgi:hypothetical protein
MVQANKNKVNKAMADAILEGFPVDSKNQVV